MEDGGVT